MGKNCTCHEDIKDSLYRNNVFKCTCYTIDHGKHLAILQLRGLQPRAMVDPLGHLVILKLFCHKQRGGSAEWVKAGVAAEHSWTELLWPRMSLTPAQSPHCSCSPWERPQRTWGIKARPRAENKRWKTVQLGWMRGTLFMPEGRRSSRENGIKDIPIHNQHTTTLPELYFPWKELNHKV